jgi:hypothetical protein
MVSNGFELPERAGSSQRNGSLVGVGRLPHGVFSRIWFCPRSWRHSRTGSAGRQMMSHATPSPYPDARQTREREPADYENLLGGWRS